MAEQGLICNYRNCKIQITRFACVTKCFHVFCQNHVVQGEGARRRCYACGTVLEGNFDVIQHANINPSEDLQSFILTGYSYKVISHIMTRAIQFWDHQINTNIMQYKTKSDHLKSCLADRDRQIETLTLNIKHYIKKQQEKVHYLKSEVENLINSDKDLEKKLQDKNQQLLNLQSKYEDLRRNNMASIITQETSCMETDELEEIICSQRSNAPTKIPEPSTPVFIFNPQSRHTSNSRSSSSCHSNSSAKYGSGIFRS